ncbi:MAG: GH32 C-terminal domain-containing protein [Pirellulaceae bacterium]
MSLTDLRLENAVHPLPLRGQQLEIIVEFAPGDAKEVGVRVLKGPNEQTVIGVTTADGTLFVDRTQSGLVDFHPAFAGRHTGPLLPRSDGHIRLHVLVDACSVEVFGNHGATVITDLVFPSPGSDQVELFAAGGGCQILSCQVFALHSATRWGTIRTTNIHTPR